MNRFTLKLLLFLALWYEIAAEFRIDADILFVGASLRSDSPRICRLAASFLLSFQSDQNAKI